MSAKAVEIVFLVLVSNQLLASLTFLGVYLRESGWRRSVIGRHLAYWVASAAAVDASWLLLALIKWQWLVLLLFAAQAIVIIIGWQRVWLAWQARSR